MLNSASELFSEALDAPKEQDKNTAIDEAEKIKNEGEKKNIAHRDSLIHWMTAVVSLWLLFVVCLMIAAFRVYGLSDTVLCMLLGTTTVNVLGLATIVLKGLFHHK